jgi:GNAT superfamily N-acetyltransferase
VSDILVRPAVPGDEAGIARVHVQGWHEAYTGRIPSSLLDRMDIARYTERWGHTLAGKRPPGQPTGRSWVAVRDDEIIGFASSGPCRDPDRSLDDLELYAIYLLAAHYGSGAGAALLEAALGDRPATLWVLEDNPRAQAFYAKHRFDFDGALRQDKRWGEVLHEVRMAR